MSKKSKRKILRMEDLTKDQDEFEFADGTKVLFRSRVDFDAQDLTDFNELRIEIMETQKVLEGQGLADIEDDDELFKKGGEMAQVLGDQFDRLLKFLLPDITDKQLKAIRGIGKKTAIIEWWTEQNHPKAPGQKASS